MDQYRKFIFKLRVPKAFNVTIFLKHRHLYKIGASIFGKYSHYHKLTANQDFFNYSYSNFLCDSQHQKESLQSQEASYQARVIVNHKNTVRLFRKNVF